MNLLKWLRLKRAESFNQPDHHSRYIKELFPHEDDTAENRLKKTLCVVEATSAEQFYMWKDYSTQSRAATPR